MTEAEATAALVVAGVSRPRLTLTYYRWFDGRTAAQLAADGTLTREHVDVLIAEEAAMTAAYERSGLARSTAPPTSGWQCELSIPGGVE